MNRVKKLSPAFGKTCFKCNGKNHFAVKCKLSSKKKVQTVETQQYGGDNDSSSVSDYGHVDDVTIKEKVNVVRQEVIKAEMIVKGRPISQYIEWEAHDGKNTWTLK